MERQPGSGEESERGQRASFDPQSGEVHGSGSGAGGGADTREDFDSDPMSGGGSEPVGRARSEEDAIQHPIDRDEGI